ncbi:transglutaminase TgpA family protein [Noviherbaspirillum massiliense]|uniref:transglutaminase TgpA family protein n=1 Tax=Noviherbaspirillum massiliense TaxID=1465823 RepID=UPI000313ED71|nr:DUF3488 and transglutaminase-like domain-containing protein [Noviherbaspirillum massiliense]
MKTSRLPLPSLTGSARRPMSRDKADTLLLLVSCAIVLVPHAGHLPGWIIPACIGLLLWRGWVTFHGMQMPPRWLLLPVAALTMGGVYWTHRTLFGQEAGVSMLALLLTLKLLEMHAKRDLFVVLFLSFFLILASFFYSQSIATACMTIVAVIAMLTTQLSFQYTGVVPPLRKRLRLGAMILGLAVPLTLVLFMLFPRIQGPLWGLPQDTGSGRTGLSDSMSPGNISRLAQSEEIAFRAKFDGTPPPKSKLYWRGPVLGNYDGRTWTALQAHAPSRQPIRIHPHGAPVRYQVTLEPHGRRWLFALDVPQTRPEVDNFQVTVSPDLEILATRPLNERVRYDAASFLDYALQPEESRHALQAWLALPPGFNPRTLEFGAQLRRQHGSDNAVIDAVLRYFRKENFRYTLEPPPLGRDVADEFLFSTRAGFCEHYSNAFVILMRAAGIPARVVTGYQGGEVNPDDGFLTVRQSDAHAWAEVWLEHLGWTRVDPTAAVAPERIETNLGNVLPRRVLGGLVTFDAGKESWLSSLYRLRYSWEALNNAWNQWVLSYTPERQRNFLKWLGFEDVSWRTLAILMTALGCAVLALTMLPLLFQRRKTDPVDALFQTLCKNMARRGIARAVHEGPRAYAARLTAQESPLPPNQKAAAAGFLTLYEHLRYGLPDEKATDGALTQLKSLLAECR